VLLSALVLRSKLAALAMPLMLSVVCFSTQIKDRMTSCLHVLGCTVEWTRHYDQNSLDGTRHNNYTTSEKCREFCLVHVDCVAVDFNSGDSSCWLHFSVTNLLDNNTYRQANTTQYRLTRICSSLTTGLISELLVSSTVSRRPQGCICHILTKN